MFWTGGPGGATTRALRRLMGGADPATCGHPEDGGNGTAMRGHPVGVLRERDDVLRVAAVQSKVTHGHPGATAAAQAIAALVWDALNDRPLDERIPEGIDDRDLTEAWRATHRDAPHGERLPAHLRSVPMNGWYTVAAAHAIVLRYASDPLDAIAAAAGSGGDTDTVACVAGGIVGARMGLRALPEAWTSGLVWHNDVEYAIEALVARFGDDRP
jgi:ADP-ribosylglycohydrolase